MHLEVGVKDLVKLTWTSRHRGLIIRLLNLKTNYEGTGVVLDDRDYVGLGTIGERDGSPRVIKHTLK